MSEEIKFEKALERLEKIVDDLETGNIALDDALKKYEEGVKLSRACQQKLLQAEKKIELLSKNLDGSVKKVPFDAEDFDETALEKLGITVGSRGKMPDVAIYYPKKDWVLLIEAVTSHGPVDSKRRDELSDLFKNVRGQLVYITAFPTRAEMTRYLNEISWETEVWVAEAPTHLIHFNGMRFLGPYDT